MLENQLAPGLMRLKTKLSPGITTRPEGSIGERISKSDHLTHYSVVPEEFRKMESILIKKISSPHFTFISKTGSGLLLLA